MEKLNLIVAVVLGLAVVVLAAAGDSSPPPPDDAWFQQAVINNPHPVVVKFGAEWCPPCRMMDAALTKLEPQFASRARFLRINVDEKPALFRHYASGSGIPQIMIFRDGRRVAQQGGFGGEDALRHWIAGNL